ncbi:MULTISPECIES: LysR family transcriptional regulator [Shimia]|uniref:LysR family transcriptional regulator n=1 Tax=Shimia TaxID=573139 RepID=UPI001FB35715|nr:MULTISPECIES: LysR family transcriptional regulator [Shimia]MDV4143381.1 LysR family transcriptional regulator [Shimia sp. FJ5]
MDNWDEIRTAFQVARMGTVSGAADVLGVHHATVIRHIDALEGRLGVKLFQRHARGYTPTEAGEDLMRVAKATDDQFGQLEGRIKGQGRSMEGELVVTSLETMAPVMVPLLSEFQQAHPDIIVRYLTGTRLFRLEYGEAHVALRAGPAPEELDNVVQALGRLPVGLFASPDYIARHGRPESIEDLAQHRFVGPDEERSRVPYSKWMTAHVARSQVMFRTMDWYATEVAVVAGAGIGFLPVWAQRAHPELVEVIPRDEDWSGPLWLVTHVDLHRTHKVQTFLSFLKDRAPDWSMA